MHHQKSGKHDPKHMKKKQDLEVLDGIIGSAEKHMTKPFQKKAPTPDAESPQEEEQESLHPELNDDDLNALMIDHEENQRKRGK